MTKNTLFNFVKEHKKSLTLDASISNAPKFKNKQNKAPFFLFELPITGISTIDDGNQAYTLVDHHLSIYQGIIPGQYHYTATLEKDQKKYLLHVYYDEKDRQVGKVSLKTTDNIYIEPDEELALTLANMADTNQQALLSELRKQQQATIAKLQRRYGQLDRESADLSTRAQPDKVYLRKLRELSQVACELSPLTSHNYYINAHKLLLKLITCTENLAQTTAPIATNSQTFFPKPQPVASSPATKKPSRGKSITKQSRLTIDNNIPGLMSQINKGMEKLPQKDALTNDIPQAVEVITKLYAECAELLLLLDDETNTSPAEHLRQITQCTSTIEQVAADLIKHLIDSSEKNPEKRQQEIELIKKMNRFHYLIGPQHLIIALQNDDGLLLDFLLTHNASFLNNQAIFIQGNAYKNAVHYCLERKKKSSKECFATLLKHNACLTVASRNGIPAAHVILSNKKHPLHQTLTEHLASVATRGSFYTRLYAAMKSTLTPQQQEPLQKAIHEYKFQSRLYQLPQNKWSKTAKECFFDTLYRFEILKLLYPKLIDTIDKLQEERKKQITLCLNNPNATHNIKRKLVETDIQFVKQQLAIDKNTISEETIHQQFKILLEHFHTQGKVVESVCDLNNKPSKSTIKEARETSKLLDGGDDRGLTQHEQFFAGVKAGLKQGIEECEKLQVELSSEPLEEGEAPIEMDAAIQQILHDFLKSIGDVASQWTQKLIDEAEEDKHKTLKLN